MCLMSQYRPVKHQMIYSRLFWSRGPARRTGRCVPVSSGNMRCGRLVVRRGGRGLNMLTSHHHMHQQQNTLPVLDGGACRNKVSLFSHQEYFGWYITLFGLHTIWEVSSLRITNQFAQLSLEPFLPPPVQDVLLRPSLEVTG